MKSILSRARESRMGLAVNTPTCKQKDLMAYKSYLAKAEEAIVALVANRHIHRVSKYAERS